MKPEKTQSTDRTGREMDSQTVYVLGAGVNKAITTLDGVSPPLATDLFKVGARLSQFNYFNGKQAARLQPVFEYIESYWRLDREALAHEPFDLEECFTLIGSQIRDLNPIRDAETGRRLHSIFFQLNALPGRCAR